mmetsp:Transcript_576/g.1205  ORF Transcript_576/g.1205 Transcript_576/m.1205 type:complete len:284 (-) Transcript_576:98-949(-)
MMISLSQSRIITQPLSKAVRSRHTVAAATAATRSKKSRAIPLAAPLTLTQQSFQNHATSRAFLVLAASSAATLAAYQAAGDHGDDGNLFWKIARCSARNLGAEPVMLSPKTEPATGILFPRLCNGMSLAGCGVRIKWRFVKVYAVGTYLDPLAMSVVKDDEKELKKALLDPNYPRTIRIVMNRNLSIDKYTSAIIEALEPRMAGQDLESLDEFKKMNPPVDLVQGAEMEMTIRGDTLLYKNAVGGLGQIKSIVFTRALCDVYYGEDAVSPSHLEDVIKGVKSL